MLALLASVLALAALPQESAARDVAELLEQRCAVCHSEGSETPKAERKWANANDLAATAANEDLVVAGDPDESELYVVLDMEEMPPEDSDVAPLTETERALVAEWIRAGALVPEDSAAASDGSESTGKPGSLLRWISHFHPLIVHFPIGLLTAAFLAELLYRLRPSWRTDSAATFCLALGALSSVPSAALGWLLAAHTSHSGFELDVHRWLGTLTAALALFAWWGVCRWPNRRLLLLLILAAIVGAVGHTGGALSFGSDWLKPPFL